MKNGSMDFIETVMRSTCMMFGRVLWCVVCVGSEGGRGE